SNRLQIRGTIRGWGVSTDGGGGLTRPTVSGQVLAMKRAYSLAAFDPGSIALVEAHGTGTPVGDPVELTAIATVRRDANAHRRAAIGSVKANIGHTKAAAGVAGLIKVVMAVDRQILPAATACEDPHPLLHQYADVITAPSNSCVWPSDLPLRAGVSAMGFGGINVHMVLESPTTRRRGSLTNRERSLITAPWDCELFVFAAEDQAG